jgi:AcrR family transcriptional regulator
MTTENEQLADLRVARRPHGPSTAPGEPSTVPGEPSTVPGQRAAPAQRPSRQRNPRGQGERLRDDIIEAASRLMADPAAPPLTLRAVAREVGVAATSVYLHFADIESLTLAVAERRYGELVRIQDEAREQNSDPWQRLRAGCLAYCEFGLAHQGHYQVMFANPLPMPADMPPEQFPGLVPFRRLLDAVARCIGAEPTDEQAFFTAQLIWQQLHGIVSLRISRPRFPWPPLAETVTEAVDRLLTGARRLLAPGRFCLSFLPNGTWSHRPVSFTPAPADADSSSPACRTAPPARRPPPRTRTPHSSPSRSRS